MTYTATASRSTTTTEARVRYVMQKVAANFTGLVVRGLVSQARADEWAEVVTYLLLEEALDGFQVQFDMASHAPYCIHYAISTDGSIQADSPSGGLDYYGIVAGTPVGFCLNLKSSKRALAHAWLQARGGWTFNGRLLAGDDAEARSFSSGGFGVTRSKRGAWV
jgi:Bacterial HORMA domain family 1